MAVIENKNAEGYPDPTAYSAMRNLDREEERFHKLRRAILIICDVAGFEIRGPIVLINKKSGKVWR